MRDLMTETCAVLVVHTEPMSDASDLPPLRGILDAVAGVGGRCTVGLCPDMAALLTPAELARGRWADVEIGTHHHEDDGWGALTGLDMMAEFREILRDALDDSPLHLPMWHSVSGSGWQYGDRHHAARMSIPAAVGGGCGPVVVQQIGTHPADVARGPVPTVETLSLPTTPITRADAIAAGKPAATSLEARIDAWHPGDVLGLAIHPEDHAADPGHLVAALAYLVGRGVVICSLDEVC